MTGRSNHERMALHLVWGTRVDDDTPASDARELLAMCGLIDPDGHQVLPDPATRRDVEGLDGEGFRQPASQVEEKITDRPKVSSAPPGLRDYASPPEPPAKPRRKPRTLTEPGPSPDGPLDLGPDFDLPPDPGPALSRPLPQPVEVPLLDLSSVQPEHGTAEGAVLLHRGESLCVRCQGAVDRAVVISAEAENHPGPDRRRKAPRPAKKTQPAEPKRQRREKKPPTTTDKCGRPGGYDAHRTRGENACDACKAKAAERQRAYVAARAAAQGKPAPKPRKKATPKPATPAPAAAPPNTAQATTPPPSPTPAAELTPPTPLRPVTPAAALADELDDWFAAGQRSPVPEVRRAANLAIAALIHLRVAMDDLARAERQAHTTTHPTAGAQP